MREGVPSETSILATLFKLIDELKTEDIHYTGIGVDKYIAMWRLSNGQIIEPRWSFLNKEGNPWMTKRLRMDLDMFALQLYHGVPRENFIYYLKLL